MIDTAGLKDGDPDDGGEFTFKTSLGRDGAIPLLRYKQINSLKPSKIFLALKNIAHAPKMI